MKHPIYNEQIEIDMIHLIKRGLTPEIERSMLNTFVVSNQGEREYKAFKTRIITKIQVEYYGCNLIQLKQANEWDEVLSVKTIEKMNVDDLKLPFKAYTIDLTKSDWTKYDYIHIAKDDKKITLVFEVNDAGGKRTHLMFLDSGMNIKDEVDKIDSSVELVNQMASIGIIDIDAPSTLMREAVYKVISISMYVSMFSRDRSRVDEVKVANLKSKRKRIPGHTTNIVYLSQPKYKLQGATGGGGKPTGLFVVKGHWRTQPIGKRGAGEVKQIFIDSFFKGQGSKQVQKIYKV